MSLTDKDIYETIPGELQAFYDFLLGWPLDEQAARTPLVSEDQRSPDQHHDLHPPTEVAEALFAKAGNMEFFLDQLPTNTAGTGSSTGMGAVTLMEYRML